jgi:hypothetical protein
MGIEHKGECRTAIPATRSYDGYSETRVAVLRKHHAKWLFPQEKATS